MQDKMKERISRLSLIVYAVLFVLSGFLLSAAGGRVEWFAIMGVFAFPPIVCGPRGYRVLGIVALLAAVIMALVDFHFGQKFKAERIRMIEAVIEKAGSRGGPQGGGYSPPATRSAQPAP